MAFQKELEMGNMSFINTIVHTQKIQKKGFWIISTPFNKT